MGTPLAPALATIVIADLEERYLLESTLTPTTWLRYIDDVFAVWTHGRDALQSFIDGLNRREARIHFTWQSSFVSAVFLDLRIYKPADIAYTERLATSIYLQADEYLQLRPWELIHRPTHPPGYRHWRNHSRPPQLRHPEKV